MCLPRLGLVSVCVAAILLSSLEPSAALPSREKNALRVVIGLTSDEVESLVEKAATSYGGVKLKVIRGT
jgi:hypothetical protein